LENVIFENENEIERNDFGLSCTRTKINTLK